MGLVETASGGCLLLDAPALWIWAEGGFVVLAPQQLKARIHGFWGGTDEDGALGIELLGMVYSMMSLSSGRSRLRW
jgi:hypothetical protein